MIPVTYVILHLALAVVAITMDTSRYVIPLLLSLAGIPVYLLSTTSLFTTGPLRNFNGENHSVVVTDPMCLGCFVVAVVVVVLLLMLLFCCCCCCFKPRIPMV